ncbi:MAG: hypothetical protein HY042_06730, partial [Spirochaetia bacterium]|nr:hypothetical protein [Spirochaetia bacterium]
TGFFTVLGGKYTTSRALAEKVVDQVAEVLPGDWKECGTESRTLLGGQYSDRLSLENSLCEAYPWAHPERVETLVSRYGSEAGSILARTPEDQRTLYPVKPGHAGLLAKGRGGFVTANGEIYTAQEIDHILEEEDVAALCDLYFRRAGIGTPGQTPADVTEWLLDKAAATLSWTRADRQKAAADLAAKYDL